MRLQICLLIICGLTCTVVSAQEAVSPTDDASEVHYVVGDICKSEQSGCTCETETDTTQVHCACKESPDSPQHFVFRTKLSSTERISVINITSCARVNLENKAFYAFEELEEIHVWNVPELKVTNLTLNSNYSATVTYEDIEHLHFTSVFAFSNPVPSKFVIRNSSLHTLPSVGTAVRPVLNLTELTFENVTIHSLKKDAMKYEFNHSSSSLVFKNTRFALLQENSINPTGLERFALLNSTFENSNLPSFAEIISTGEIYITGNVFPGFEHTPFSLQSNHLINISHNEFANLSPHFFNEMHVENSSGTFEFSHNIIHHVTAKKIEDLYVNGSKVIFTENEFHCSCNETYWIFSLSQKKSQSDDIRKYFKNIGEHNYCWPGNETLSHEMLMKCPSSATRYVTIFSPVLLMLLSFIITLM